MEAMDEMKTRLLKKDEDALPAKLETNMISTDKPIDFDITQESTAIMRRKRRKERKAAPKQEFRRENHAQVRVGGRFADIFERLVPGELQRPVDR